MSKPQLSPHSYDWNCKRGDELIQLFLSLKSNVKCNFWKRKGAVQNILVFTFLLCFTLYLSKSQPGGQQHVPMIQATCYLLF